MKKFVKAIFQSYFNSVSRLPYPAIWMA